MKTFKRANLPQEIKYNGKLYVLNAKITTESQAKAQKCICIKVLSDRLRGKKDLHGKFYKSSVFYFREKREYVDAGHRGAKRYTEKEALEVIRGILSNDEPLRRGRDIKKITDCDLLELGANFYSIYKD